MSVYDEIFFGGGIFAPFFVAGRPFFASKKPYVSGGFLGVKRHILKKFSGVIELQSGFSGGSIKNLTFKQVVKGGTGDKTRIMSFTGFYATEAYHRDYYKKKTGTD